MYACILEVRGDVVMCAGGSCAGPVRVPVCFDVADLGLTVLLAEPCSTNDSYRVRTAAGSPRARDVHLVLALTIQTFIINIRRMYYELEFTNLPNIRTGLGFGHNTRWPTWLPCIGGAFAIVIKRSKQSSLDTGVKVKIQEHVFSFTTWLSEVARVFAIACS